MEYWILWISPWEILNRKCITKLSALYYLLPTSTALLLYLSYVSILFPFQEQYFKKRIFLNLWIIEVYCSLPYFFPWEYRKECILHYSALAASLLVSEKKVLMKLNKWKKIFMECANETVRNKSIYAKLTLGVWWALTIGINYSGWKEIPDWKQDNAESFNRFHFSAEKENVTL